MKAFAKFDGREDIKYLVLWSLKKLNADNIMQKVCIHNI